MTHGGESGGMLVKERSCVSGGIWYLNRGCGKCLRRFLSNFRQEVDAEGYKFRFRYFEEYGKTEDPKAEGHDVL